MNDPHVNALVYRIEHESAFDYSDAKTLEVEESSFRLTVEKGKARFEMKEHFPTQESAQAALKEYIANWEFCIRLKRGPDSFRLELECADIINRAPSPGTRHIGSGEKLKLTDSLQITTRPTYPSPPSDMDFDPDDDKVKIMFHRYMISRQQPETLTAMAYFCRTMLELPTTKRKEAAKHYCIAQKVLSAIGRLSSTKGGRTGARKSTGVSAELTPAEREFLEEAMRKMIIRAAKKAHPSSGNLRGITLSDLPPLG